MTELEPQSRMTGRQFAAMLAAMAAAVATLMVWTRLEERFIARPAEPAIHYVSLAAGVLLSVAVYTAVTRAIAPRTYR
ncbi:MAG: hypothetical protein HY923_06080 [Elusimicrobia bacterium]|nr:hypothetical protein [Elusimicrobiota bacterium]